MLLPDANKQIGLFGGSFDPPHLGHVALVQAGLELGLDEVWVIPALPVHRELSGVADGEMRLIWMEKVFAAEPRVKVLDWEVSLRRPSPAVETLRRFKAAFPKQIPWLMLGADAWQGLESWREYPAHRKLCNIMVFARQGLDRINGLAGWQHAGDLKQCSSAGHWLDIDVRLPDISATMIRDYARQGKGLSQLVPAAVCSEVEKKYAVMKENM